MWSDDEQAEVRTIAGTTAGRSSHQIRFKFQAKTIKAIPLKKETRAREHSPKKMARIMQIMEFKYVSKAIKLRGVARVAHRIGERGERNVLNSTYYV